MMDPNWDHIFEQKKLAAWSILGLQVHLPKNKKLDPWTIILFGAVSPKFGPPMRIIIKQHSKISWPAGRAKMCQQKDALWCLSPVRVFTSGWIGVVHVHPIFPLTNHHIYYSHPVTHSLCKHVSIGFVKKTYRHYCHVTLGPTWPMALPSHLRAAQGRPRPGRVNQRGHGTSPWLKNRGSFCGDQDVWNEWAMYKRFDPNPLRRYT